MTMTGLITAGDMAEALRALGVRDVVVRGDRIVTLGAAINAAQRRRLDAVHVSVILDDIAPRADAGWRPVCCLCVDALEVALNADVPRGGRVLAIEAHRINAHTSHDTGCCSFCGSCGPDTLVASIDRRTFAEPSAKFLEIRCAYADQGGQLAYLTRR